MIPESRIGACLGLPRYRRVRVPGRTDFLTVNPARRGGNRLGDLRSRDAAGGRGEGHRRQPSRYKKSRWTTHSPRMSVPQPLPVSADTANTLILCVSNLLTEIPDYAAPVRAGILCGRQETDGSVTVFSEDAN